MKHQTGWVTSVCIISAAMLQTGRSLVVQPSMFLLLRHHSGSSLDNNRQALWPRRHLPRLPDHLQVGHQCRGLTSSTSSILRISVSGPVYESTDPTAPIVIMFTKDGCTLCDQVKDVLQQIRAEQPHSLELVDITDEGNIHYWDKYKYDIPVLYVKARAGAEGLYWAKHRLSRDEAVAGLGAIREGRFHSPMGEPDAAKMESKQADRLSKE